MRKILITGASNGLGFALAEHFLSNGETVVINTRTPTIEELTEKKIVANLDHLFLVVTNFPSFNLINSAKIAIQARNENIPFTILINKQLSFSK